jgi:enoyl-CoA hydratase/carnithine racemase
MRTAPSETILTEKRERVLWITINRPDVRNAMTLAMYERLFEALGEAEQATDLGAVVLIGAGKHAFVAGTDIKEFENFKTPEDALRYEQRMDDILTRLERLEVPTIAALRGACTGGGAAIASACDLRIASPSLRFGFPIARTLGNCLSIKNYARLVALVGEAEVKRMIFTAELLDAERAYARGLVAEIVPDDAALEPRAQALALQIAGNAPLTIRSTKEALRRLREQGASAPDADLILACYQSRDFREGMNAFLEKRPAVWKGN